MVRPQPPQPAPPPRQSVPEASQSVASRPAPPVRTPALMDAGDPDLSPTVPMMLGEPGVMLSPRLIDPPPLRDPGPSRPAQVKGRRVRSALRGLLVTPWFAASTGFVIAAGMWLYSPHASISFPSAIGTLQCPVHGCLTSGGKGSGSLTSAAPGQRLKTQHKGSRTERQTAASTSAAGLTFTFTVLWQGHNSFGAMIAIAGRRSPGSWQLAFRLPGTQIQNVFGAEWLPLTSSDGGTASPFEGTSGRPSDQGGTSFRVFGTGSLTGPTGCTFDGATCTFKVTSAHSDWPGSDGHQGSGGGGGQDGGGGGQGGGGQDGGGGGGH